MSLTRHNEALAGQYADVSMPPNVLSSERALLGAVLWHGPHLAYPLREEDFYSDRHQRLFGMVSNLYERKPHVEHFDPIAVKDEMFRVGRATDATDMFNMFDEAVSMACGATASRYHVERILETAQGRAAMQLAQRAAQVAGDPVRHAEAVAAMQASAADYQTRLNDDDQLGRSSLAELARINRLAAATTPPAMSTGLIDLDRALNGGLRPSTLNILGARPGVGKSLLAGSIAVHMGSTRQARVLYVTMELSAAEVTNRMLANISGVDLTRMQNPDQQTDHDLLALDDAQERYNDWPIHVIEGSRTIEQVESAGRSFLGDVPAGLMVVDFLGRIREDGTAVSRERHVALCASRLTDLSRELRIPILCVVSFNRDSVKRQTAPRMDDIRDSGNVESDADTVMLLWQPSANDPDRVEVVIDKNRYGQVQNIDLIRQGNRGRLVNASRDGWGTAA
jgi:replicative DNA helicase